MKRFKAKLQDPKFKKRATLTLNGGFRGARKNGEMLDVTQEEFDDPSVNLVRVDKEGKPITPPKPPTE